jgi:hypothetical protein
MIQNIQKNINFNKNNWIFKKNIDWLAFSNIFLNLKSINIIHEYLICSYVLLKYNQNNTNKKDLSINKIL